MELARRVSTRLCHPLCTLDFGGGLGVPYFPHEQELDLATLQIGVKLLCAEVDSDSRFAGAQFLVDPGRFIIAEAGVYVTRVSDVKVSRGKKFLIVDGGMNHNLAASGNLGQTIKRNYPIAILNKLTAPPEDLVDIVGPLRTPLHPLPPALPLPRAQIQALPRI